MENPHDLIEKGKKHDALKVKYDKLLLTLKELDEAMDNSTIEVKQGSAYHVGIKELLKEIKGN